MYLVQFKLYQVHLFWAFEVAEQEAAGVQGGDQVRLQPFEAIFQGDHGRNRRGSAT